MTEHMLSADAGVQKELELIRDRMLHALEVFPFLSRSMIHMAIGTATATGLWHPILQSLLDQGHVCKTEVVARTPLNRPQTYTIYHLPKNIYIPSDLGIIVNSTTANQQAAA
jgi:hypothetical protein